MTRKDYIKFAQLFAQGTSNDFGGEINVEEYRDNLIVEVCNIFEADNPRFDRRRFELACSMEVKR